MDKIFIREIKEKGAYIKNPLFKGCMAININIDDIFKASGSFSRGVKKDKQSKNILKPVEVPKKPLNDTESIEVLELEKFEWEDDIF